MTEHAADSEPTANAMVEGARRVRALALKSLEPHRISGVLGRVFDKWRDRKFAPRRECITRVSVNLGFSIELLDESLDALLAPFTPDAIDDLARRVIRRTEIIGFVIAGNVVGAGLHEFTIAMLAGAGLAMKCASTEPVFFTTLARTIVDEDRSVGDRILVASWSRVRQDLTAALASVSDVLVAYGDNATIGRLVHNKLIGFGSKLSCAIVSQRALSAGNANVIAENLGRDVTLFEQLGCLSPHQVFVECDSIAAARTFALQVNEAMSHMAERLPPPGRLALEDAAALRSVRETARWRSIAGEPIEILEGENLSWTVILDPNARLTPSPGLRCLRISMFHALEDLDSRLRDASGLVEACALAVQPDEHGRFGALLDRIGVTYKAAPGMMQSPPLTWRHGGGIFLDHMTMTP